MVEKSTSDFSRFVKRFSLSLNALNDVKDTSLQLRNNQRGVSHDMFKAYL
jgi:hypothetical protein